MARCDGAFKHHLDRYKYPLRHPGAQVSVERASAAQWLLELEARLQGQADGEHSGLLGNTSLPDMAIAPFVRQFAHTDPNWFASQPWPRLQAWLSRLEASALFERVMAKYPPWISGSIGAVFPSA